MIALLLLVVVVVVVVCGVWGGDGEGVGGATAKEGEAGRRRAPDPATCRAAWGSVLLREGESPQLSSYASHAWRSAATAAVPQFPWPAPVGGAHQSVVRRRRPPPVN
jgi:hypothetical protein